MRIVTLYRLKYTFERKIYISYVYDYLYFATDYIHNILAFITVFNLYWVEAHLEVIVCKQKSAGMRYRLGDFGNG